MTIIPPLIGAQSPFRDIICIKEHNLHPHGVYSHPQAAESHTETGVTLYLKNDFWEKKVIPVTFDLVLYNLHIIAVILRLTTNKTM
jgi:hypothetical protein